MTFGEEGKEGARVHDLKDVAAILDVFQKYGYNEVHLHIFSSLTSFSELLLKVDTAYSYTGTTSEKYLGDVRFSFFAALCII